MLEPEKLNPIGHVTLVEVLPSMVRFQTDAGPLEISAYAPGIFRFRMGPRTQKDYHILNGKTDPVSVQFQETEQGHYELRWDSVVLLVERETLHLDLKDSRGSLLTSTTGSHFRRRHRLPPCAKTDRGWFLSFHLHSGEPIYGLGEKFGPLNHRGQYFESYNHDALGVNAEISYKNNPFAWSPHGWGMFVHTTSKVAHGVGFPTWSHRSYGLEVQDEELDLFFMVADASAGLLQHYVRLTGAPQLPPVWSYGTWISRAYYRTAEEALEVAQTVRKKKLPCDVITLDGRAWLDTKTRFAFEWDPDRYPDPKQFTEQVRSLNFKLCVWEYPLISIHHPLFKELEAKGWLLKNQQGETYIYEWDPEPFGEVLTPLPPSGMIDFTHPDAYQWYGKSHHKLFKDGVDAMKTDFGEQVPEDAVASNGDTGLRLHNLNALLYNRCVYEASRQYFGNQAMVWGRSGWAGSHRYPIQWGGDPQADWEGLAASIRGALSWGMSGGAFYSHDIGGFYGGQPDKELFIRWTQAAVLSSHCRFHGIGEREPWHIDEETESIIRQWLQWRYQLIPYLELCATATRTGLPMMRSMVLAFPEDAAAWPFDDQYMLGDSLLVGPILRADGKKRVYFPQGRWFNYWTGERIRGGYALNLEVPLNESPVFVKSGSVIPLGPVVEHTGEITKAKRVESWKVFDMPDKDSNFGIPGLRMQSTEPGVLHVSGIPESLKIQTFGNVICLKDKDHCWFEKV